MEKYKKVLQTRIKIMGAVCCGLLLLFTFDIFDIVKPLENGKFSELLRGFQFGLISVVELFFVYFIVRYMVTLQNENELKKLYYAECDERAKMIREKTGGNVNFICAIIILIAGIVGGYFNEIVFFSLVGCSLFLLVVKKVLKLYYMRKY